MRHGFVVWDYIVQQYSYVDQEGIWERKILSSQILIKDKNYVVVTKFLKLWDYVSKACGNKYCLLSRSLNEIFTD